MFVALIFLQFVIFLALTQSLKIIKENQRGVLFRLGRFERIIKPGLIVILPCFDRLLKVDLNNKVPGWQGLSQEQLEAKVKEIAVGEL